MVEALECAYVASEDGRYTVEKRVVELTWAVSPRIATVSAPIPMHPPHARNDEPVLHVHATGRSAIKHLYSVFRGVMLIDIDDQQVRADVVHDEFRGWLARFTTVSDVTDEVIESVVSDREAPLVENTYYPGIAARRHAYLFTITP